MRTMKTIIEKLLKKHKTKAAVASLLGISERYVLMILKEERQGGKHLKQIAKMHL